MRPVVPREYITLAVAISVTTAGGCTASSPDSGSTTTEASDEADGGSTSGPYEQDDGGLSSSKDSVSAPLDAITPDSPARTSICSSLTADQACVTVDEFLKLKDRVSQLEQALEDMQQLDGGQTSTPVVVDGDGKLIGEFDGYREDWGGTALIAVQKETELVSVRFSDNPNKPKAVFSVATGEVYDRCYLAFSKPDCMGQPLGIVSVDPCKKPGAPGYETLMNQVSSQYCEPRVCNGEWWTCPAEISLGSVPVRFVLGLGATTGACGDICVKQEAVQESPDGTGLHAFPLAKWSQGAPALKYKPPLSIKELESSEE